MYNSSTKLKSRTILLLFFQTFYRDYSNLLFTLRPLAIILFSKKRVFLPINYTYTYIYLLVNKACLSTTDKSHRFNRLLNPSVVVARFRESIFEVARQQHVKRLLALSCELTVTRRTAKKENSHRYKMCATFQRSVSKTAISRQTRYVHVVHKNARLEIYLFIKRNSNRLLEF